MQFTSHSKTEHDVDNSVPPTEYAFIVDYFHEWLLYPTQYTYIPHSRERVPMVGAPYKSAKEGGGHYFECFGIYKPQKNAHVMFPVI